ncbi:MobA/MobL family protein [Pseudomonas sp. Snoq117.2]|uniref:MobA/MobL family protein n=2 Tax=Pseudomonadota TaxID=1224 RepID=UPI0008CE78AE|nr:MobA/MobL family protein [Pseudomonas sp. Snoq117.2]SEP48233.1 MobA/MobL family protein [Pseudomonas sp. Snoq117.2]
MANVHCSVKNGRAGKGAAHALYVQGEGRYASRDDVAYVEHDNMPDFAATDPLAFWKAADANERANGRAYTEIEFSVPRELAGRDDQIRFARQMAYGIVGVHHPYTLAMHDTKAADGGRNVHVHLMFSERALDGIERGPEQFFRRANKANPEKGGAAKNRAMNARSFVADTRERYEQTVNRTLEKNGYEQRINMARNPRFEPEPKLGPVHARAGRDERREARVERVREIRAGRSEWQRLTEVHATTRSEIIDLSGDIRTALEERTRQMMQAAAKVPASPREALARFRAGRAAEAATRQGLEPASTPAPSEDELRARDASAVRAELAGKGYTTVQTPKPGQPYPGTILLVTDFHVAQHAGRDWATLHDRRQLLRPYEVGESPRIQYGQDGQERVQTASVKRRGPGLG